MKMRTLLKTLFFSLALSLATGGVMGQYTVNFEGSTETKTAYASGSVTLSGLQWNMTEALIGNATSDWKNGTKSARLRGYGISSMTMLENKANGIGTLSFDYRRYGTDAQVDWKVEYSTNDGSSWTQIGSNFTAPASDVVQTFNETVNVTGNVRIRIKRATETGTSNNRLNIDDITITDFISGGNQNPAISNITQNPAQLIQSSTTVSVSVNVTDSDGTVELVELRWGLSAVELGNTIAMTSQGGDLYTTTTSIPANYNGTTIYYAVYAEDNDGGNILSTISNYEISPIVLLETFDSDLQNFITYSVQGESKVWELNQTNNSVQMNGFDSGEIEEDWLIFPVNIQDERLLLSFDTWKRYGISDSKNYLRLYYSTDYPGEGDPTQYSWNQLNYTQPTQEQTWTYSEKVLLPLLTGETIFVGFKYRYIPGKYVWWNIDNIQLEEQTYMVTFNVTEGTTPLSNAYIDFYNKTLLTNQEGSASFDLIDGNSSSNYRITLDGFHPYEGTVTIGTKNTIVNPRLLRNTIAINPIVNPSSNSAVVTWDGSGAENYAIIYKNLSTLSTNIIYSSTQPTNLPVVPSTNYELKMATMVDGAWTSFTETINFTTTAGVPVIATDLFVDNITSSSATINWIGSGADQYGVVYYDVNTYKPLFAYTTSSPITIPVTALTSYEVRVRSQVNGVWLSYSEPVSFNTPAGNQVIADNLSADQITSSSIRISWNGEGADQYRVYYQDLNTSVQYYASSTTSPLTIPVVSGTTFNVRVRTMIDGTWIGFSQGLLVNVPDGPQLMASNLRAENITNNTASIVWDGSGADLYRIYYTDLNTNNNFTASTTSSQTTINVMPETTYRVTIRSLINGKWTAYSDPIQFTTPLGAKSMPLNNSIAEDNKPIRDFVIFPNPATSYANIGFRANETTDITIRIFDIRGSLMEAETLYGQFGDVQHRIDISNYKTGLYFIQIITLDHIETLRLMVQ